MKSRFQCGDPVMVGDISGVVEEIIFARNSTEPLILVEWWKDGDLISRRFHEQDVGCQIRPRR